MSGTGLQERHSLQVLFDYRVHNHLEDNLDVGGVGRSGEVVVDEFAGSSVERDEGGGDEAGRRIHIAVCTWRDEEGKRLYSETSGIWPFHRNLNKCDSKMCIRPVNPNQGY